MQGSPGLHNCFSMSNSDTSGAAPSAASAPSKLLPLGTLLFLIVLTALYLLVELAFNARLLDVVGGGASTDEIHRIEISGRLLSGLAAALFVLQYLLKRRADAAKGRRPRLRIPVPSGWFGMLLCCCLTVGGVYAGLQALVDHYVEQSSPTFRRQALNIVLIQQAIVDGRVRLTGLERDPKLFASPEGKAFLALFPVMAASVEQLDTKIEHAKLQLIGEHIGNEVGGPKGYYESYRKAIQSVHGQWEKYDQGTRKANSYNVEDTIEQRHNQAWNNYLRDLGKQGWTPSTVPPNFHDRVRRKVRQGGAPVPADWELNDEAGFRAAVAREVRRKTSGKKHEVKVRGQVIPPNLSFAEFVRHSAIQAELRDRLQLPRNVVVPATVANPEAFRRQLYEPMRTSKARQELAKYDAPLATFADDGKNAEQGKDAARAALVPPIALGFSLLGAITHFSKLVYLLLAAALVVVERVRKRSFARTWPLMVVLAMVLLGSLQGLSYLDNRVTTSHLYHTLIGSTFRGLHTRLEPQPESDAAAPDGAAAQPDAPTLSNCLWSASAAQCAVHALHVVAVGQGYAYPYNEHLRVHYLQGMSFGYHPQKD